MLSDISLERLSQTHKIVEPFQKESTSILPNGKAVTSFGLSSFGYDLSLGPTIRRLRTKQELADKGWSLQGFHNKLLVMDPSNFNPIFYTDVEHIPESGYVLMPDESILSVSNEHVNMPPNISAICMQKSTCARTHLRVEVTPLEAGWSGYVTYEITNPTEHPILLHVGQGITQAIFLEGDQPCSTTYLDRGGKYQNQPQEPVIPRSKHKPNVGYPYLHWVNGKLEVGHLPLTEPASVVTPTLTRYEASPDSLWAIATEMVKTCQLEQDSKMFRTLPSGLNGTSAEDFKPSNQGTTMTQQSETATAADEPGLPDTPSLKETLEHTVTALRSLAADTPGLLTPEQTKSFNSLAFDLEIAGKELLTRQWYNSAPENVSIEDAIKVLAKAVHTDQGYAWTWICNLAMMAQDAGATSTQANRGAANLVYNLFKYRAWAVNDTYKDHIKDQPADGVVTAALDMGEGSFGAGVIREGLDKDAIQALIAETRATGTVSGCKPGSTADKLGIVRVDNKPAVDNMVAAVRRMVNIELDPNDPNPQATVNYIINLKPPVRNHMEHLVDKMMAGSAQLRTAEITFQKDNMEEILPALCKVIEQVRDGVIDTLVVKLA